MVQILCPHCEDEIELDDNASGEFACPHCDGEFEWNVQSEVEQLGGEDSVLLRFVSGFFSGSLLITGIALLVLSVGGFPSVRCFGKRQVKAPLTPSVALEFWRSWPLLVQAFCFSLRLGFGA